MTLPYALSVSILLFTTVAAARGQHAFALKIPDSTPAITHSIVQTPDGGFCLFYCYHADAPQKNRAKDGQSKMFAALAKFSPDGLIEWSRYAAVGEENIVPVALAQTPDGGFAALGVITDKEGSRTPEEIILFRFNAHGYLRSGQVYRVGNFTSGYDCIVLENGTTVVTGEYRDSLFFEGNNSTSEKPYLLRLDESGDVLSCTTYPEWKDYRCLQTKRTAEGNVLLFASPQFVTTTVWDETTTSQSDSTNKEGNAGALICELDAAGMVAKSTFLNKNQMPDSDVITIADVTANNHNGYTLAGYNRLFWGCGDFHSGFTATSDAAGNVVWVKSFPGMSDVFPQTILRADNDGITLMAYDNSSEDPLYFPLQLGTDGTIQTATILAPFPSTAAANERFIGTQSTFLSIEDGGAVLAGSIFSSLPSSIDHYTMLVTRLSPDLLSCNYRSQSIKQSDQNTLESLMEPDIATAKQSPSSPLPQDQLPARTTVSTPVDVTVTMRAVVNHRTIDLPVEPQMVCQENSGELTSSVRPATQEDLGEFSGLVLSPNSLRPGGHCQATFKLQGSGRPDVAILGIATGHTVREIAASAVLWSGADGNGSAAIQTSGLPAGVYLVRVRAGEQQLTAKLEVR